MASNTYSTDLERYKETAILYRSFRIHINLMAEIRHHPKLNISYRVLHIEELPV